MQCMDRSRPEVNIFLLFICRLVKRKIDLHRAVPCEL